MQHDAPQTAEPAAFDFYDYLFVLERVLPKRGKARKLLPGLETYVEGLKQRIPEPFDGRNYEHGAVRATAERELLDLMLAIPFWNKGRDGVVMTAFNCWLAITSAPSEVQKDALDLLKRERSVSQVTTFVTLRDKGHVALTPKSVPAKGGYAERFDR